MKKEDKQLLLQDLCARLLCHVIVEYCESKVDFTEYHRSLKWENCKPYLRPMSKMTKKEKECVQTFIDIITDENYGDGYSPSAWDAMNGFVQYCDTRHLDHRGLIFRGLALEAPDGMYKV